MYPRSSVVIVLGMPQSFIIAIGSSVAKSHGDHDYSNTVECLHGSIPRYAMGNHSLFQNS